MVPQLRAIVEQLGIALAPGGRHDLDQRSSLRPYSRRPAHWSCRHRLGDACHGGNRAFRPTCAAQARLWRKAIGELEGHVNPRRWLSSYDGVTSGAAAISPPCRTNACERLGRRRNNWAIRAQRGMSWANCSKICISRLASGWLLALALMGIFHAETLTLAVAFRWLHVFFGVTWIGLLYYFNFVQIPTMPTVPAELKPGVSKYIAPKALFFFRWGAALTVLTGAILAWLNGYLVEALTLQPQVPADRHRHVAGADHGVQRLGRSSGRTSSAHWGWSKPTMRARPSRRGPRCWPRGSTPCCRSRCSTRWRPISRCGS